MLLRGKTVLVTGVGVGLGRECAAVALREGANVVLAARRADELAKAAEELDPGGERSVHLATDITDPEACASLVAAGVERFGTIDALVQVAAYDNAWGGLYDLKLDDWRAAYDTNVLGALTLLRPVASVMKEHGGGSVVFIGSQSMFKPALPQAGYAASKGALLTTIYYLADELGPDNIRCNMVVPSWMWGPNVELYVKITAKQQQRTEDDVLQEMVADFPLRRMTEDGEVAEVAAFFASDHARAVTGQYLLVNAGEISR
ncbi:MAG TPA: SDR family oxidoreductase [Acidimicrobiales bacterium]|nr:SDR family oxidoreductase [Acidimicrobiales bacterium]